MFPFIDLFSGIGGFRRGFESVGGRCVLSCEIDKFAQLTYQANFCVDHPFPYDIAELSSSNMPSFDVLLAGFPCQPFSKAGKLLAMNDKRANCISDIVRIIDETRPKVFVLENVPYFKIVNNGKVFENVLSTLRSYGYSVSHKIIDACHFVPQNRKRLFILGVRGQVFDTWFGYSPKLDLSELPLFSGGQSKKVVVADCLEEKVDSSHFLSERAINQALKRQKIREERQGRARGGYKIINDEINSPTLISDIYTGRLLLINHKNSWRRLTPREYSRLMGFDAPKGYGFVIPVSKTQAYKQFGNAVVPQVAESIANHVVKLLRK